MSEPADGFKPVNPPRPLMEGEEKLLAFLLSRPFPGRDELQKQLRAAKVSEEIGGGYFTCILSVDRSAAPVAPVREPFPVEAEGLDDGVTLEVLLHTQEGYLFMLEIIRMDGKPPTQYPDPTSLELFVHGE